MMYDVLVWTIVGTAVVFAILAALIVVGKASREAVVAWHARRRRVLEPSVLEYAHGEQASIRDVLGGSPGRLDRGVLETILLDHVQRVRGIEHDRLARALDDLGFIDDELRALTARRWWRRAAAAERLGLAGVRRAAPALAAAVGDDESEVRIRAAKALGALGGTASARRLVEALDQPNRWSTIRIADILTDMGREVVDEVTAAFDALGPSGKVAALDILGRIRPLHAAPWLGDRLGDPDTDVRARAAHALGCIGDPQQAPALIAAAADPEWPVRAMAVKALGRMRGVDAVPTLCVALCDAEWWVRHNAATALRGLGRRGIAALESMLDSEDRFARHQAILMLEEEGVVDRRVDSLVAADVTARAAAEALVRRLIAAGQTGRLRALAEDHGDDRVRMALAAMLPHGVLSAGEAPR